MVEFCMRKEVCGLSANGRKVGLCPAFLKADNVGSRGGGCERGANVREASGAVGCEVFEAPAVEGEDVEFLWLFLHCGVHTILFCLMFYMHETDVTDPCM